MTDVIKKASIDKMFWIGKLNNPDLIVDFGCANGFMLDFAQQFYPKSRLVGYDIDPIFVEQAKGRGLNATDNWREIEREMHLYSGENDTTALIVSSVMHELYSYKSPSKVKRFWGRVFNSGFDFVAIRDMALSRKYANLRPSGYHVKRVRDRVNLNKLHQFEERHGPIKKSRENFIHFLLKYKYSDPDKEEWEYQRSWSGWDRELKENYFPLTKEELRKKIPFDWEFIYYDHYTLPHLKFWIREEFGFDLIENTHVKIIVKS